MRSVIDGDPLVYSTAHALQVDYGTFLQVEPLHSLQYVLNVRLRELTQVMQAETYKIYLTDSSKCFRRELYPEYKANRAMVPRPILYHWARDHMVREWGAEIVTGIEADDAVAKAHMEVYNASPFGSVICSIDKDLNQLPGYHYLAKTQETVFITPEQARRNFWIQVLMGDRVDNVKGVAGIGPKKAVKALEGITEEKDYYQKCLDFYGDAAILDLNIRLLSLRTEEDEI